MSKRRWYQVHRGEIGLIPPVSEGAIGTEIEERDDIPSGTIVEREEPIPDALTTTDADIYRLLRKDADRIRFLAWKQGMTDR